MIEKIKEYLFGKAPVLWFPDERTYKITECENMPSAIGMTLISKPKPSTVVKVSKEKEFRTFKVQSVEDFEGGFYLKTQSLKAKFIEV
jgi:hypothetical protein